MAYQFRPPWIQPSEFYRYLEGPREEGHREHIHRVSQSFLEIPGRADFRGFAQERGPVPTHL